MSAVGGGGNDCRDYVLSLSLAKDIAMLSRGAEAQKVRDYFKACEKTVQTQAQQLAQPNSVVQKFIADIQYAKLFAEVVGADAGKVQKYVIEEGTRVEQSTGVKVLVPQILQDTGLVIDFNAPIGTLAHAAEVGVGTTFTNVTKWAKDMYGKASYSTLINNTLIELGYAVRMKNLKITATNLGSTFANNSPIAKSCHTKLTDTPTVNGWNLEDKRFTDVVFPVIQHKINIGLKK